MTDFRLCVEVLTPNCWENGGLSSTGQREEAERSGGTPGEWGDHRSDRALAWAPGNRLSCSSRWDSSIGHWSGGLAQPLPCDSIRPASPRFAPAACCDSILLEPCWAVRLRRMPAQQPVAAVVFALWPYGNGRGQWRAIGICCWRSADWSSIRPVWRHLRRRLERDGKM